MSPRKRRYFRIGVVAVGLLAATAWVAPFFFNAERYRPLLKAQLEHALHRKVIFGHITLHFFPRPGFTLDSVVIEEQPEFGLEPFARVGQINCGLRWGSLWHLRPQFGILQLDHPSINIVRSTGGEWNVENLLLRSAIGPSARRTGLGKGRPGKLTIEAHEARLNFKLGQDKKPFAITNAQARLDFGFASHRVRFRVAGDPVRTDLELPTPGRLVLEGTWTPSNAPDDSLNATLRTQGALLYDWVPLVTGHNPEVYGLLDTAIHLTGTLRKIRFAGLASLSQLHRWERLPPSSDLPCHLRFRGSFDRDQESLSLAGLDLAFANSEARLEGSISGLASRPKLKLVLAFQDSRAEDLLRLGSRVLGERVRWDVSGRVKGEIAIEGSWGERRYSGALNAQEVRVHAASETFPVFGLAIRIGHDRVRISPTRIVLAPGVEVVAEGTVRDIEPGRSRRTVKPKYDLTVYSASIGLSALLRSARALGLKGFRKIDVAGVGSGTAHLTGTAWPLARPSVTARAEVRSARVAIPGLRAPLNISRASLQVYGDQVIVNPLVAVMGTSVFSGWLLHEGGIRRPWGFSLKADRLSVEQGAGWFEGVGNTESNSLFERLAGIGSLISGHRSPSPLAHLNAQGEFSASVVTYRALSLRNFKARLEVGRRTIRASNLSFEAGGGRGKGKILLNVAQSPAEISSQVTINRANLQSLLPYLPPSLAEVRGFYSASGHFEAQGLNRAEIASSLRGVARVRLEGVDLGDFNPIGVLARRAGMEVSSVESWPVGIAGATAHLRIQNRRVILQNFPVALSGAKLDLAGSYAFGGATDLMVRADLSGLHRPWAPLRGSAEELPRVADAHLVGTMRKLEMTPSVQLRQTQP